MTQKTREKTDARLLQAVTGMPYSTCLRLLRGEVCIHPRSESCELKRALQDNAIQVVPKMRTPERMCRCGECLRHEKETS